MVSVDSAQVYRGMDIGTAKPGPAERARVPHHLIDLVDPDQHYSAGQFRADAIRAVEQILARGRIPLLVGGTMLYYRSLAQGLDELPHADAATRKAIDEEARLHGWPALHAALARVERIGASAPLQRPGEADEVARTILWLASDEASYMTGALVDVTGGR